MQSPESRNEESIEAKKERLLPIFRESFEQNLPLAFTRRREGGDERIEGLVVWSMNEDGPELCVLDADGQPGPSATMLWSEIIDAARL